MTNIKILSEEKRSCLSSLISGPTISIFDSRNSITALRKKPDQHFIATLIAGDRKSFSNEYISRDKNGREILKSDLFQLISEYEYIEVAKGKYSHHHITGSREIDCRLNSIIDLMLQYKNA